VTATLVKFVVTAGTVVRYGSVPVSVPPGNVLPTPVVAVPLLPRIYHAAYKNHPEGNGRLAARISPEVGGDLIGSTV
jgi:hypothetical protein